MAKWGEWIGGLEASGNLASGGAPLHLAGKNVNPDGVITDMSLAEVKEIVAGYSIVKAETLDEAAEHAKARPFLVFLSSLVTMEMREMYCLWQPQPLPLRIFVRAHAGLIVGLTSSCPKSDWHRLRYLLHVLLQRARQ